MRSLLLGVLSSLITLITPDAYKLPPSVKLIDGQVYDYIVVGAGAGGAAVAARLALAGQDVLLVEAGGNPNYLSKVPVASMGLLGSNIDWQYKTISNNVSCLSSTDQQCRFSRGKCLGGSTSINYMLYTRGNRKDFNDIIRTGWTFDDLIPYFLRYEGLQNLALLPPSSKHFHNTTGTMQMDFFYNSKNPWHSRLIESYRTLNFPFNPDVNAESQIGITQLIGFIYEGERMSTARGYLAREDVKKTLKIAKNTICTGITITKNKIVRGITAVQESHNFKLFAKKEVILSAGTIGTPQILMLSGIGPADHLKSMDISVKVDLPVGDGLTDHILPLLILQVDRDLKILEQLKMVITAITQLANFLLFRQGALSSNGLTDISIFANTRCFNFKQRRLLNVSFDGSDCEVPNLQIINAFIHKSTIPSLKSFFQQATGFNEDIVDQLSEANKFYAFIIVSPILLEPRSKGTVRLMNKDPSAPPAIYPNYLEDERDVDDMVRSIGIVEQLIETPMFRRHNASVLRLRLPGCPKYRVNNENYWRCYVRHMTYAVYHATGTVSLNTVLDARLRVLGVKRLRVADLSVLPTVPHGNTGAVSIAIGEKAADMLLEDNQ